MSNPPESRHFRIKPRLDKHLSITFGICDTDTDNGPTKMLSATTDNIGAGGAFIAYPSPLPVGTKLLMALELPTRETPLELRGTVKWIVAHATEVEPAGMGVEFVDVAIESILEMNAYFASLAGTDA